MCISSFPNYIPLPFHSVCGADMANPHEFLFDFEPVNPGGINPIDDGSRLREIQERAVSGYYLTSEFLSTLVGHLIDHPGFLSDMGIRKSAG